jgi:predicted phage terminase large subunit-like protein
MKKSTIAAAVEPQFDVRPCSVKQRMVLTDDETDVLLVGGGAGGGKSYMALLKALKYIQDPNAKVLIVRLTYPLLKALGGLVDEAKHIYPHFGGEWRIQPLEWHFPNGAMIKFVAMPTDRSDVQGWQATNIIIDEGAEFQLEDILALKARLRGARYKGKLNITITCNPSRSSWLFPWIEWCLDRTTGVPVGGTEDYTRWFVILNGKVFWGTSREALFAEHGAGYIMDPGPGEKATFIPVSFRFIPMTVYDNPVLLKNNPEYLANLLAQTRVAQLRFLHGSWTAVVEGSSYIQRSWIPIVHAPPPTATRVRSWDLAATTPSEVNPDPDYTASVLLSRTPEGIYYIEHANRDRKLTDGVLKMIVDTARDDGLDIPVTIPKDSGAGGKAANGFFIRYLAEAGLTVSSVTVSGHSGKVQRFLPFASMCEAGLVRMVEGPWNDLYLTELEQFSGSRNDHDDWVDATSDAFNKLCKQIQLPTFAIPDMSMPSILPRLS